MGQIGFIILALLQGASLFRAQNFLYSCISIYINCSSGRRFLTGGELLELWIESDQSTVDQIIWKSVWKCETPTPVYNIEFSSDGAYFASCGKVCLQM